MTTQPYLSDDLKPPGHNEDIERSLDAWLDAKDEQRSAAETTKLRHATLLLHLETAGVDSYPYTDRRTGKRKRVKIKREPKVVTGAEGRHGRRDDVEIADAVEIAEKRAEREQKKADEQANIVEKKRVRRTKEHDAAADPFAGTREKMER